MYVKFCNFGNYVDTKEGVSGESKDLKSCVAQKQQCPDVNGRVRLYRRMSVALLLLCVLLLAVVLALAIKLTEVQTKQECPDVDRTTTVEGWSREKCDLMYPRLAQEDNGHLCSECGKGWLKFEDSCYFLSKYRLTWQESRDQCQKWGGDLAVIINDRVQTFLTEKGLMFYWIGLHDLGRQQWTWINNTALIKSYWGRPPEDGQCAFLRGQKSPQNNWYSNPCAVNSHYVCQKG
ncbi:CD209 antigen-like protein C isoform X2 [Brachyhypopomus gauderio]|uniref:CD209 antigen-like protein C isoform X2 n=1 Tax=Brachyhypopomus gauderio TaxID=698409 RepID=UPI004041D9C3